ncbi:MAG: glycosyltransferase family 8 protein [Clostridiales bacterium]|nr:glycosyltransferase family 8 protein [Clostridiales bacterium]
MKEKLYRRGWNEADVSLHTPARAERGKSLRGYHNEEKERAKKGRIPLFFATDDNYLPFLSLTLESILENSSREYEYEIYVLHSGLREDFMAKILRYSRAGFTLSFVDVTERLKGIAHRLHIRDYYTCTTYFRMFIAEMFPLYDKAIYLDCDTVVLGDISELYAYELGDNLLAGAPCEGVNSFEVYKRYVAELGGLDPDYFFNAGVLLLNLKAFREENFYGQFADLLEKYKFKVIQDEDYLNVLCQDRVLRLPRAWNKTPVAPDILPREDLRIVHYLMTWKPWRYSDIPYQEYFWEYAKKTEFYGYIKKMFDGASKADMEKDKLVEKNLKALAEKEIAREDGYFKVYGKRYGKIG